MRSSNTEHHCKHCHALLAKEDREGLCIRRGALEAKVRGEFRVTIGCYRCRATNELSVGRARAEPTGAAPLTHVPAA